MSLIVDMCYEQVQQGGGDSVYTLERALKLCNDLEQKYDKIRAKYWQHMAETMQKIHKEESNSGEAASSTS